MRPRHASRAVLVVIGLGLLAFAARARAQQAELPEELRTIESVRYTGLHAISTRQLLKGAALRTRRPSKLRSPQPPSRSQPLNLLRFQSPRSRSPSARS